MKKSKSVPLWLQQTIADNISLKDKIDRLELYMQTPEFQKLSKDDMLWLFTQQSAMNTYLSVLNSRIEKHLTTLNVNSLSDIITEEAHFGEDFGISDEELFEYQNMKYGEDEEEENNSNYYSGYIDVTKDNGLIS